MVSLFVGFWYLSTNSYRSKATYDQETAFAGKNAPQTKVQEWAFDSQAEVGDSGWNGYMLDEKNKPTPVPAFSINGLGLAKRLILTVSNGYLSVISDSNPEAILNYSATLLNINADAPFNNNDMVIEVEMKSSIKRLDKKGRLAEVNRNTAQIDIYTGSGSMPSLTSTQRATPGENVLYTFVYSKDILGTSGKIKRLMFKPTIAELYYIYSLQINRISIFSR